jgi:hypothetical protein
MMRSLRKTYKVKKKDINYIRWTVESYDGAGLVRTLDPIAGYIEVLISPGCENIIDALLSSLRDDEGIDILEDSLPA